MSNNFAKVAGSFRDPKGHIYEKDGGIYRSISNQGIQDFEQVQNSGLLDELVKLNLLLPYTEIPDFDSAILPYKAEKLLQHPKLDFVSYPYEWSFPALKDAALLHLDIQLRALKQNIVLSDASAYNIQFQGANPIFIDHLSFRPYKEGEFWLAHRQFCEQFLTPLLLRSYLGIAYNNWYRGALEGINLNDTARLLPLKAYCSYQTLVNVILPAKFESSCKRMSNHEVSEKINQKRLPKQAYMGLLDGLKGMISKLEPKAGKTVWEDYQKNNSYADDEAIEKKEFITEFVKATSLETLWDIGCNSGEYSELAISSGANTVIGFEFDQGALELSYQRAQKNKLNFLPLYLDLANPSPSQGWNQSEREGIYGRRCADGLIVLALIHHLCIARNIPLDEVVNWLVSLAPQGIIEFVPKTDPMVIELIELREDVFQDYSETVFEQSLKSRAKIEKTRTVTGSGRKLYWYSRL
jgi:ribosomal protein L11 methylase PrmA